MISDPCLSAPAVNCNQFNLQDPITQRYLLAHLLVSLINAAGGSVPTSDAELISNANNYVCQGSANKLRLDEATAIANADLTGVDLRYITCWPPLNLEAVFAYLVCEALAVSGPRIL